MMSPGVSNRAGKCGERPKAPTRRASGPRIALFLPSLAGGGAERSMLDTARQLTRAGFSTDLIVAVSGGALWGSVPPDVRLIDLDSWKTPLGLPGLVYYIRRERPVAMIATLEQSCATALAAKWFVGREFRLIVRQATIYSAFRKLLGVRMRMVMTTMRLLLPWADAIWAVSGTVAEDLRRVAPRTGHLIHVVVNPVVDPALQSKAREPLRHPWFEDSRVPVVLTASRLASDKDTPTLLRAFAVVVKRRSARLVVLGDGEERTRLEALAGRLGIRDSVDFLGFQANPFAYMARARAFVLSSALEGLPGALIQAMACGTSVVSTDAPGGAREVLEGGRWGRLVPVGNASAMADAICETIDNPASPETLIRAASRYSTAAFSEQMTALLRSVLGSDT